MLRPISRIQIHSYIYIYIYIYTLVQTITSVQAKLEVVRRKHIIYPTGLGAYSSTCCKATDNCAGTMGVDQLPSPTVRLLTLYDANNDKRPSRHVATLTFCDEFVQKYIGSRWIIGIRDITFSNFIIVTVKCFPTIDWGCVMTTVHRVSILAMFQLCRLANHHIQIRCSWYIVEIKCHRHGTILLHANKFLILKSWFHCCC